MADKSPAFQFYPRDFMTDDAVLLMTNEQIGAYVLLLCQAWLMPDGLPAAMSSLARFAHCTEARFARCIWPGIRVRFQQNGDGRWFNPRLEKERAKQLANTERQSGRGRKGAEERWRKHSGSIAQAMPSDGSSSAIASARDCADGAGDWFWCHWRRVLASRISLPSQPKAVDIPTIVEICTLVPDRPSLLAALERFVTLPEGERLRLGVKSITLGFFKMALPDLVKPVKPCPHNHQPPCADEIACTKRYLDESERGVA
jgi:uncharacterized protein YdaU (DUF1376 family)